MTVASVTDLPPIFDGIEAVCFDVFGTLVEITDKPRELIHWPMREDKAGDRLARIAWGQGCPGKSCLRIPEAAYHRDNFHGIGKKAKNGLEVTRQTTFTWPECAPETANVGSELDCGACREQV